jgi:hypothetical protein
LFFWIALKKPKQCIGLPGELIPGIANMGSFLQKITTEGKFI